MTPSLKRRGVRTGCLLLVALIHCSGCSKNDPEYEIVSLQQAKIEKIDPASDGTGEITVSYYSEKSGQQVVATGSVTKETEIMINGVIAKLEDLRVGERIRGEVRIEKKGKQKKQIALKIYVDRPKPIGGSDG